MITNERQYAITKAQAERFKETLAKPDEHGKTLHPKVRKAMREGLQSQLQDLETEIAEFERLRDGKVTTIVVNSIVDIAVALIQARIARNWTQKQLAEKLNLPEQQIQRYESPRYKGAAVERLQEVADALGVRVQEVVTIEQRQFGRSWLSSTKSTHAPEGLTTATSSAWSSRRLRSLPTAASPPPGPRAPPAPGSCGTTAC
ncbi:MAG: helix-turn-helix transcriptional regulator [Betaproteobacteria bacterium]|nr:helix-turn-helix transcriptional regulator [Betaproteobacteria bacterium]